ncbi:hypothetical protein ACXA45_11205 [Neomicrococcus lactis]
MDEKVDGADARVQTLSQEYLSDINDVWDAVKNAERIPRCFLPISGDLKLGGHYQFEGNAGPRFLNASHPPTTRHVTA